MKRHSCCYFLALPAMLLALSAQAHDPKDHVTEAQAPDCSAMKGMDHSNMDVKDPVMQAMMQKCMTEHGKQNEKADKKPARRSYKKV